MAIMAATPDSQKQAGWLKSPKVLTLLAVLPQVPLIVKVVLLHLLRISESSKYLDLKSDVTVSVMRAFINPSRPGPVAKTQALTTRDPGIKGRIWVSKVASGIPPENHIRDVLLAAIDALREGGLSGGPFRIPELASVEAEWTGYRAKATLDATLPLISEAEKYEEMMKECRSSPTILYFHGGAYYLCDPATHRPLTRKLAKLTGGRVYSVRYRLAPQNPFPSALLDALVAYFTLLYPPPGSIHEAVPARDIVLGGDSAGGNLSLALLQALLQIRRQGRRVVWYGAEREVPLPGAVTACSPWVDMVQSMPSWQSNAKWDYLPVDGSVGGAAEKETKETKKKKQQQQQKQQRQPVPDAVWPANPPRRHIYVDDAYVLHPLASLQFAASWAGAPPVYVCCGWECLADEGKFVAAKMAREGVPVVFEEYEAMPHVSAMILPDIEESRRNLRGWADFVSAAVRDPAAVKSSFTTIRARTLEEVEIDPARLCPYSEEDVRQMARDRVAREPPLPELRVKL